MQKKIIALAVAGLMSGAAFAQSNVTIYGVMHGSWDSIDTDVQGQDRLKRVTSNFSRIGFKGTEALGNGLSANWQIEQQVGIDGMASPTSTTNTGAFAGAGLRNTYVGLSSKTLGEFRLGKHDTPYKMSTGSLDVFADTAGDYNAIIGSFNGNHAGFDKRADNTLLYLSPSFNGMQVTAHYGHDNETGNSSLNNPSNWGLAATYANGPLFASLAYERHNFADTAANAGSVQCLNTSTGVMTVRAGAACNAGEGKFSTVSAVSGPTDNYRVSGTKLGIGYTFMGTTKVGFIYEHLNNSADNSAASRNAWGLNVAHTMGNIVLKAAYTKAGESDANNVKDGAKNWALGVDYNMSKRTQAYAVYTKTDNELNAAYGLGHTFYSATTGKDPSAVSFGLKHAF